MSPFHIFTVTRQEEDREGRSLLNKTSLLFKKKMIQYSPVFFRLQRDDKIHCRMEVLDLRITWHPQTLEEIFAFTGTTATEKAADETASPAGEEEKSAFVFP